MKVTAFIAHPDYAAHIIGGTLIKHALSGDEVTLVVMSPGELGIGSVLYQDEPREKLRQIRRDNMKVLAEVQGLREVRVLDCEDFELMNDPPTRRKIAALIRELKPDILITHFPNDSHADLRTTGQIVIDSCVLAALGYIKMDHPAHAVKRAYGFFNLFDDRI
jgi:N-acetylglucosamine malate deacetylase 1